MSTTDSKLSETGTTGAEAAEAATKALNSLTSTRAPGPISRPSAAAVRDIQDELEMGEQVNHPAHYGGEDDPYEAIKVIEAWELGFNLGSAVKYLSRAGRKPGAPYLQDLEKAAFYLQREIEKARG